MEVMEKNSLSKKELALLIGKAIYEKENKSVVNVKCPQCGDIVDVELLGNSARTKCSCGLMNDSLRGI